MQFQINGQEYFLAFAEDERRWCVIAPTETGVYRIPVYADSAEWERAGEQAAPKIQ